MEPRSISQNGNATVEQLSAYLARRILGIDAISPDQNFFDLGGDSSLAVQMFAKIRTVIQGQVASGYALRSPHDRRACQDSPRAETSLPVGRRWSPFRLGSRPPFFCMHGAGGTVLMYRDLSRRLGDDQPFYGFQSQGLDGSPRAADHESRRWPPFM